LSDRYGRRPILLASIFSSALGWLVFALAPSVLWLFIGRIIDGLAAGNISTAHSAVADLSKDEKERTHNLGLLGAVFGIGFIIGPGIGGLLGAAHAHAPFWFAFALSTLNLLSVYFFLPETNRHLTATAGEKWWKAVHPGRPLWQAWQDVNLRPLYIVWFIFNLSLAIQQSIMALYLLKVFGLGSAGVGWLMAGVGLGVALNQAVGLKHFWLKYFAEPDLQLWLLLVLAAGFFLMGQPEALAFAFGMLLNIMGQSVLRVVTTSQAAGSAPVHRRGEVLGVLSSVASLGTVIGPLLAGQLFTWRTALPFWTTTALLLIAFIYSLCNQKKLAKLKAIETPETNLLMD
jgi:DHA1 family tetracycline resistance protein-like MFS transporter